MKYVSREKVVKHLQEKADEFAGRIHDPEDDGSALQMIMDEVAVLVCMGTACEIQEMPGEDVVSVKLMANMMETLFEEMLECDVIAEFNEEHGSHMSWEKMIRNWQFRGKEK